MKTFVYGRPSVEGGDRGYRIFQHQGLQSEELKGIQARLSDEDPDVRRLEEAHFQPFYVWFPWQDDQWVFGKGRIEARGRLGAMYYSYLFHGVVLDARRREGLRHNPFVLADFFDLGEARRAQPPLIPDKINDKGLLLNLHNKAVALLQDPALAGGASRLAEALLAGMRPAPRHDRACEASFWGMVFALLPATLRADVSLTTWAPFLPGGATVMVYPGAENVPDDRQDLAVREKGRAALTPFIERLARPDVSDSVREAELKRYEAVADDLRDRNGSPAALWDALDHFLRATERPAVQALEAWPRVGARGFPYKAEFFCEVWACNRADAALFPGLADRMTALLQADYAALPDVQRRKQCAFWENLFALVGNHLSRGGLRGLLQDPLLGASLFPHLSEGRLLGALTEDGFAAEDLRIPLAYLVADTTRGAPLFARLVHMLWGRFLMACRAGHVAAADRARALLAQCHAHDETAFVRLSARIPSSHLLHAAPPFLHKDAFVVAVLKSWGAALGRVDVREHADVASARLRVIACAGALYGTPAKWPAYLNALRAFVADNWLATYCYDREQRRST